MAQDIISNENVGSGGSPQKDKSPSIKLKDQITLDERKKPISSNDLSTGKRPIPNKTVKSLRTIQAQSAENILKGSTVT